MEIKAYVCPQCGASLDVNESTTFTFCPHCGNKLHISYNENEGPNANQIEFKTAEGLPVASAIVPRDYTLEAVIHQEWESEIVPIMSYIRAASPENDIILSSASKQIFFDYHSASIKALMKFISQHTEAGCIPYVDQETYIKNWAEQMAGVPLTPIAITELPSLLGQHPDLAMAHFKNDIAIYDAIMGNAAKISNELANPILYKFEGELEGQEIIALVGADYEEADLTYSILPGMDQVSDLAGKAFSGLKDIVGGIVGGEGEAASSGTAAKGSGTGSSLRDAVGTAIHGDAEGKGKMTFNDLMHGGLVGKMMRDKKAAEAAAVQQAATTQQPDGASDLGQQTQAAYEQTTQAQPAQQTQNQAASGQEQDTPSTSNKSRQGSVTIFGSQRRYMCMALKGKEEEATEVFLNFVGSIMPDESLAKREQQILQQKIDMIYQEVARNQAMAQQMQMQTLQMQQQTSQMIARNSAQVSAGIMDSWDKRQAAQSRMSTNYSEAIRGVNSYVTPTGSTVEMSVGADYVYQNKYGDTIGISGNDIDSSLASKLNWTKLEKK